jgi:hypothetical protein
MGFLIIKELPFCQLFYNKISQGPARVRNLTSTRTGNIYLNHGSTKRSKIYPTNISNFKVYRM